MSNHPRRILTPGASRKRKEREAYYPFKLSAPAPAPAQAAANATAKSVSSKAVSGEPVCPNRLLAGYMAYEFLSKGTLFGQKYDPARAEAVALVGSAKPEVRPQQQQEPSVRQKKKEHKQTKSYAEVASILKTEGAHIPGIVNPTQLAKWIQM